MPTQDQSDVLWGATAIAKELNVSRRRAFYLLEKRLLPARKIGDSWVSTRSELLAAVRGAGVLSEAI